MRTLAAVVVVLVLAAGAGLAQHHAFGSVSGFGNILYPGTGHAPARPGVSGFGNVVWPGTGRPPQSSPFSITDPTFARGLGNTVSGRVPYGGFGGGGRAGNSRGYVYVPYAYPVYMGGYDGYTQQQQPNVTVVYPPQQPPVVINQSFGTTAQPYVQDVQAQPAETADIKVYQAPARSAEETAAADVQPSSYYLIAFKDHSIYSAVAYWIDGDTLHYFTSGNTHNQVSLALVDRELTERLNRERKVDVRLPR